MKKLFAVVSAGAVVAFMIGCGLNNPKTAPRISIDTIGSIAISTTNDVTVKVKGKIDADTAISSITATVETAAGAAVPTTQIGVATPQPNGQNSQDLTDANPITLTIKSAAVAGNYKLKITVVAGPSTISSFDFTLTGGGVAFDLDTATLVAGANQNPNLGSSIDLDLPAVYKMSAAASHVPDIDICYAYSGVASVEKLFSPAQAKASSFDFAVNWTNPNSTQFYKTTLTAAQFAALTSKVAVQALWNAANAVTTSVPCAQGDVFIAKTNLNATVLMLISAQTPGDAGQISLKIAK